MVIDFAKKKVLAVSSSGGHWVQLMRLRPAWNHCDVAYLTTQKDYREDVDQYAKSKELPQPRFYHAVPASRWGKWSLIRQFFSVARVVLKERPDIVISTGASIGFFAVCLGKLISARTIWIDSIANVEQLSLSGEKVRAFSDAWVTQWPHLSGNKRKDKPEYWGQIL